MKKNVLLFLCMMIIAGCASVTAYRAPDRDLIKETLDTILK